MAVHCPFLSAKPNRLFGKASNKTAQGLELIRGHADAMRRKSSPIFFQPTDKPQNRPDLPVVVLLPLQVLVKQPTTIFCI